MPCPRTREWRGPWHCWTCRAGRGHDSPSTCPPRRPSDSTPPPGLACTQRILVLALHILYLYHFLFLPYYKECSVVIWIFLTEHKCNVRVNIDLKYIWKFLTCKKKLLPPSEKSQFLVKSYSREHSYFLHSFKRNKNLALSVIESFNWGTVVWEMSSYRDVLTGSAWRQQRRGSLAC